MENQKKRKLLVKKVTKKEILEKIAENPILQLKYDSLNKTFQEKFLNFCTGASGLPLTYDPFFKEIFNPEIHPERLSRFISRILGINMKVTAVLVNEGTRILEEGSLLIMDIVVKLEDGSVANVEIQKVPYRFPGERAACYSSDLIMRQYTKVKGEKKEKFIYGNLKKVYTIVLLEKSDKNFHSYENFYIHRSSQQTDTGLRLQFLQEYVFISLDMFKKIKQNKIEEELDAWLHCIASEEPEIIEKILEKYPEFSSIYEDIEKFRQNLEGVLSMFSDALKILDRNTVQYMVEEMQEELNSARTVLKEQAAKMKEQEQYIKELEEKLQKSGNI